MPVTITGLPGGALKAGVGTSGVAIDLGALIGQRVKIWSDDADLLFSFAPDGSNTTLISAGDQPASNSALIADRTGKGIGVPRRVSKAAPFLIAAHASGSGTVRVKVISAPDGTET